MNTSPDSSDDRKKQREIILQKIKNEMREQMRCGNAAFEEFMAGEWARCEKARKEREAERAAQNKDRRPRE